MPSRSVTLVILAFWLATLGWFFHHDLWPRLRPGDRPPYTIDLAQEVSGPNGRQWEVFYNGQTVGHATTWVGHRRADDTYVLTTKCWFTRDKFIFPVSVPILGHFGDLDLRSMGSTYRVTRDGDLREVEAEVVAAFRPGVAREHPARGKGGEEAGRDPGPDALIEGHVEGAVKDGWFAPVWRLEAPGLAGKRELQSDPVKVPTGHSVLSPLQPWNRLENVQENKVWHIQLFDPLMDSVGALLPGAGHAVTVRELEAGVKQGTEDLSWNNAEVPCLVIEYRGQGGDITGKTYVRKSDGLVLRQEMTRQEHLLAFQRQAPEAVPR